MGDGKTVITDVAVETFLESVDPSKAAEARVLDALFRKVTGEAPRMWGPSIIGYGEYSTVYDSGRKVTSLKIGFSPRKAKHSLYLSSGYGDEALAAARADALGRLGKHAMGKGCLYVNKLADIEMGVLEELITIGWGAMEKAFPEG